jgi:uncharacterized protein
MHAERCVRSCRTAIPDGVVACETRVMLMPEPDSWLSDQVQVRSSGIAGQGLFARTDIPAGVVVSRLGGRIVSDDALEELMRVAEDTYIDSVSIVEDGNLVLPPGTSSHFGNHGCDPSLWWVDPFSLATTSHVPGGEELTVDYGTLTDDPHFLMSCLCGAACCRGSVTGSDWTRPGLQNRYGEHWVPVLRERIRRARLSPPRTSPTAAE